MRSKITITSLLKFAARKFISHNFTIPFSLQIRELFTSLKIFGTLNQALVSENLPDTSGQCTCDRRRKLVNPFANRGSCLHTDTRIEKTS